LERSAELATDILLRVMVLGLFEDLSRVAELDEIA
jgi:hypothetical protein